VKSLPPEELSRLNSVLELRVRARTRELETTNGQLMRTAEDLAETLKALAEANKSLQEEKAGRERVEAELRLAHRLEAVGQLAAGVAHEINTPIQYVADSVYFLQSAFEDLLPLLSCVKDLAPVLRGGGAAEAANDLEAAWEAADAGFIVEHVPPAIGRTLDGIDRVAAIVRAMKAFAHPGGELKAPADINEALTTTSVVCKNEYKYVADLVTDFGELPMLPCQLGELNQVFLNLIVNAAHAIAERVGTTSDRGQITLGTRFENDNVIVKVSDTGAGIPAALRDKVFDPFFTTKPVGVGTGQGLTIARSIVVKHGGTLTFESVPGQGTTFEIRLPLPKEWASQ
jgi:two-component system, NtrC family, sensor kinase